MSRAEPSYLDGTEWVLRTRVSHVGSNGLTLTHDASIPASAPTRARWNADFWQLYPTAPEEFRSVVLRGEVKVAVMFRFRPSARLKQQYGGHPVLKVARTADAARTRRFQLPASLAPVVEEYERDKRRLDEQRRKAWLELLHMRLPTAPVGYHWHLVSGDARAYSDLLLFSLQLR